MRSKLVPKVKSGRRGARNSLLKRNQVKRRHGRSQVSLRRMREKPGQSPITVASVVLSRGDRENGRNVRSTLRLDWRKIKSKFGRARGKLISMSGGKRANGIAAFSREEYDNYRKSLASKKEWPGFNIRTNSQVTNVPMLLMELYRLVPYKDGRYVNFHPFNMPLIKVRKINLVGTVTGVSRNVNNLALTIEDGTGEVEVNYRLEPYMSELKQRQEIDERYRSRAGNLRADGATASTSKDCPKKFPETRPAFRYPRGVSLRDIAVLENEWWLETKGGLLGKEIQPYDHVYVVGYPCIDTLFQRIPEQVTAEFVERSRMTVFAMSVACISEKMYNEKLLTWMGTTIRQRYTEDTGYYARDKWRGPQK